eukprot:8424023-Karenia_brevis.AAC.1
MQLQQMQQQDKQQHQQPQPPTPDREVLPTYTEGPLSPKSQNHPHPTLGTPPPVKRQHTTPTTNPQQHNIPPFQSLLHSPPATAHDTQSTQTQFDSRYPQVPPLDVMPPSLTIPQPQQPPQSITPHGNSIEDQLSHLYNLTHHLITTVQQQHQTISQLTHNTHNLYNVTSQQHTTLQHLNTKTNKITQQLA